MTNVTEERAMTDAPVAVREASAEDAEALHALALELADALGDQGPPPEATQARLSELLAESRARVLVAEDENGVVGAASLWIKPDLAHGDTVVEVPMLVVSKNARRRGIGKLLVEKMQSIATAENASLIELVATHENDTARVFYRSLGFVETDHITLEFMGDMQDPPYPDQVQSPDPDK